MSCPHNIFVEERCATVPKDAIIVDRPQGLWTRHTSRDHFVELGQRLAHGRRVHGRGRVLVDLSDASVQPQDAFAYVQSDLGEILAPEDKIAFAGGGALLRLQKKRLTLPAQVKVFETVEDAQSWLEDI